MRYRYVVLGYTRDCRAEQGSPIALLSMPVDVLQVADGIRLEMAEDWRSQVDASDLLYVEAVMRDVAAAAASADESMDALGALSIGCLRTNAAGICDSESALRLTELV